MRDATLLIMTAVIGQHMGTSAAQRDMIFDEGDASIICRWGAMSFGRPKRHENGT